MSLRLATFLTPLISSLITTFAAIPDANADVNMMEASFQTSFIDLEIGGLKINRLYNSRSNSVGAFGFGWCSVLDSHLEFSTTPQGKALAGVSDCGRISNLGTDAQAIQFTHAEYVQHLKTGLVRTFSVETGELTSLRTETGPEVRIVRLRTRSRLPRDAALGEGLKKGLELRLIYDEINETVTSLETSTGKRLEFTYSPSRDLLTARNAWSNTYLFNYDALHNLTQIDYPDHTSEKMSYDADYDRILKFEGRDSHCIETYSYHFAEQSPSIRTQTSTSKLVCNSTVKRVVLFDFTYSRKTRGAWTLSNLKLTRGVK